MAILAAPIWFYWRMYFCANPLCADMGIHQMNHNWRTEYWRAPDPHKWRDLLVFAVAIIVAAVAMKWGI